MIWFCIKIWEKLNIFVFQFAMGSEVVCAVLFDEHKTRSELVSKSSLDGFITAAREILDLSATEEYKVSRRM